MMLLLSCCHPLQTTVKIPKGTRLYRFQPADTCQLEQPEVDEPKVRCEVANMCHLVIDALNLSALHIGCCDRAPGFVSFCSHSGS